ncbi:MAG: periplasmic amidohydrolase [Bacteroidia bacterium]|nr:MAG: periplasmic amidohydrolase [Bacteroidia bacterium]
MLVSGPTLAQLVPVRGLHEGQPTQVALTGVRVWLGPGKALPDATIWIADGKIRQVGPTGSFLLPQGVVHLKYPPGTWVYPAFVEPSLLEEGSDKSGPAPERPQYESARHPLFYPNEAVRLDFAAETSAVLSAEKARELRQRGVAVVHIAPKKGVVRGTGATLALLPNPASPEKPFLKGASILHAGFSKGAVAQEYPTSKMGAIALVRQLLYDWLWYREEGRKQLRNAALDRLEALSRDTLRWCWVAETPEDAFRVAALMREWAQAGPQRWALLATGYEYEWLPYLPEQGLYIVPVGLPVLPPAHSPEFYERLPLGALRRWEQAPFRFKWLVRSGRLTVLTGYGVPEAKTFWAHLRQLARTGIDPDTILLALTAWPAAWLGLPAVGHLAPGMEAHLLVFSDTLWKEEARLLEVWVQGQRDRLEAVPPFALAGTYQVQPWGWQWTFLPGGSSFPTRLVAQQDTYQVEVSYSPTEEAFRARLPAKLGQAEVRFRALSDSFLQGEWKYPGQPLRLWEARKVKPLDSLPAPKRLPPLLEDSLLSRRTYPNSFYGFSSLPPQERVLFREAIVWTGDTVLVGADVFVAEGKIQRIGFNLPVPPQASVIDARGRALTAGMIDEHSHIAIEGGVNEASDAITAEVRIRDVIDPTDVNLYRHLAGGVVAVQLLHGSANPIGGQSACIKLRWGLPADSFLIPDAPPFNKFALGENVKQSNWGPAYTIRYPQTRMGVELILADAFEAARRYAESWAAYAQKKGPRPRRDLRYEALAEILARKRFITCHSYVQSEILMLMRLAERYGFRVRTFTHVLEGYKVAPELRAHGAFASTFSDWWAYKYEVIDAIPYNAALLLKKGVPVCINSDDAEMGRRLNHEAAKVLRYGGAELGLDSLQAWRTVTVYPAQALGIAHRTGYVKEGYDADLVLWDSPSPLSVYSRPLLTLVDGRRLYDAQREEARYAEALAEKQRLLEKAWKAAQEEAKGPPLLLRRAVLWDCEDFSGQASADEHP